VSDPVKISYNDVYSSEKTRYDTVKDLHGLFSRLHTRDADGLT